MLTYNTIPILYLEWLYSSNMLGKFPAGGARRAIPLLYGLFLVLYLAGFVAAHCQLRTHVVAFEGGCYAGGRGDWVGGGDRAVAGVVSDGLGSYDTDQVCEWLLESPDPDGRITLSFSHFDTECTWDYVMVRAARQA